MAKLAQTDQVNVRFGPMTEFVNDLIEKGSYGTIDEIVQAGLAALEDELDDEGPELEALIKAKVAEALADPRPSIPMAEAFARARASIAARANKH